MPKPKTVWIRNDSPQGSLDVPLLNWATVAAGAVIEVSADHAAHLTEQDIWTIVTGPGDATTSDITDGDAS